SGVETQKQTRRGGPKDQKKNMSNFFNNPSPTIPPNASLDEEPTYPVTPDEFENINLTQTDIDLTASSTRLVQAVVHAAASPRPRPNRLRLLRPAVQGQNSGSRRASVPPFAEHSARRAAIGDSPEHGGATRRQASVKEDMEEARQGNNPAAGPHLRLCRRNCKEHCQQALQMQALLKCHVSAHVSAQTGNRLHEGGMRAQTSTDVTESGDAVENVATACNILQHDRFGSGSVMVWGGISLGGRTALHVLAQR
ncbi:hypothetical protein L3Q82_014191, partial [Scortum barcoo]